MLKLSKVNSIIVLIGLAVLCFISVKASISSFTHDESFSYLHYVHTSFMDIISYRDYYTNNHILNSLGMKYSQMLFGTSEFALRLPNLILFAVYLTYCFQFFRKENSWILIGMFTILSTNTYLIDLFGLARGYGLSIGFMIMSIYHFIQSFYNQKTRNLLVFHLASLLAILSSFVLIDVYLALLIIYNLLTIIESKLILKQRVNLLSENKIHVIPFVIIAFVLYEPIRKVIMYSRLDFGGKTSFYHDTATYLANYFLNTFPLNPHGLSIVKAVIACLVMGTSILIFQMILKRKQHFWSEYKGLIILNLLILLIVSVITVQHLIFKADFPISRFSIFLLPILTLQFGFLLSYFSETYYKTVSIFTISLAFILSSSFINRADLRSCSEWEYDMETKNMMQILSVYHAIKAPKSMNVNLGIHWLFEPSINFYRQINQLDWLEPVNRDGLSPNDDYYYCFKDELNEMSANQYTIIIDFPRINTVLVKKQKTATQ